jgi:hypothetical protein
VDRQSTDTTKVAASRLVPQLKRAARTVVCAAALAMMGAGAYTGDLKMMKDGGRAAAEVCNPSDPRKGKRGPIKLPGSGVGGKPQP